MNHRFPKQHPHRNEGDPFVIPPAAHIERAGHHWLLVRDYDGHEFGYVVLQWQPGARRWCHSQQYARGEAINVDHYEYVGPCPLPMDADERKQLKKDIKLIDERLTSQDGGRRPATLDEDMWERLGKFLRSFIA